MPGLNSETDALHESLFLKEIRWDKVFGIKKIVYIIV